MRKLLMITAGFILAFGLISCEKQKVNPQDIQAGDDAIAKGQPVEIVEPEESTPIITLVRGAEVAPYQIPGKNKGGNRTCAEAIDAFDDIPEFKDKELGDFTDCGEKVDIDDGYFGEVEGFPFYVEVNDDGSVFFHTGSEDCKVKIVIVKGSNSANVYYFPDGVMSADGLSAPAFDPEVPSRFPWVSNLTFCCFCDKPEEDPEYIISLKTGLEKKVAGERVTSYAYTAGDYPVPEDNNTPIPIGYHWLGFDEDFTLTLKGDDGDDAGTITATEVDVAGVPHIEVVVTITVGDWTILSPWLYIGSEEGIDERNYQDYPFDEDDATIAGNVATFLIPVSAITL